MAARGESDDRDRHVIGFSLKSPLSGDERKKIWLLPARLESTMSSDICLLFFFSVQRDVILKRLLPLCGTGHAETGGITALSTNSLYQIATFCDCSVLTSAPF